MQLAALVFASLVLTGTARAGSPEVLEEKGAYEDITLLRLEDVAAPIRETGQTRRRRARDIRHLEDTLARPLDGHRRLDALIALADLYLQQRMDPEAADQRQLWMGQARVLVEQVLKDRPATSVGDEGLFNLSRALLGLGEQRLALEQLVLLVEIAPESPLVPDAYLMIGEIYFDEQSFVKAIPAYQRAALPGSRYQSFAQYKLAWCHDLLGDYERAVSTMEAVVRANPPPPLRGSAGESLLRFYGDAGDLEPVYNLLSYRPEQGAAIVEELARRDLEQGKFDEAINKYRRLIVEDPNSLRAPSYQSQIVEANRTMGRRMETLEEIDRYLKSYGRSSRWATANAADPAAVAAALDELERLLREAVLSLQGETKKSEGPVAEQRKLAYQCYKVYFVEFPETVHELDMRYNFAELLYTMKRYDEAYEQYMLVVGKDPSFNGSKFCAESAVFAAMEMQKILASERPSAQVPGSVAPLALGEWDQRLLDAVAQYARLWPEDPKTTALLYEEGYLYYNRHQLDLAERSFREVIARDVESKYAEMAAALILDAYNLKADWVSLRDTALAFYTLPGLGSETFKQEVFDLYQSASKKLATP